MSLSGQIFRVSEKLMTQVLSEIGNMMTNITGSSILKSTDHTSRVKPGKLSVRFILSDREPCSENPSSEFERTLTQNSPRLFQKMNLKLVEFQNQKMIGSNVKVQMMRMNVSMMLLAL